MKRTKQNRSSLFTIFILGLLGLAQTACQNSVHAWLDSASSGSPSLPTPTPTPPPSSSTFGTNGIVRSKITTDGVPTWEQARSVRIQADGKIVVAGFVDADDNHSNDFGLVRYNTDGSLDTSFNSTGKVKTDISPGSFDDVLAMVIQSDGKILVAGSAQDDFANRDFALVRYNSDGSLDTTFNSTGKVITDLGGLEDEITAIALQSDGKIIVGGHTNSSGNYDFALARYKDDGSLDTTFNSTGIVKSNFGSPYDMIDAIALQSDGRIIVAGSHYNASNNDDFVVARYTTSGTLDATFGTSGKVITDFGGGHDQIFSIALQTDGKIVTAGRRRFNFNYDIAVARYTTGGVLDTTFNSTGQIITSIGSYTDEAWDVKIQPDGSILVAGDTDTPSARDFALVRYTSGGLLDTTFNSTGKMILDVNPATDEGYSMTFQSDGKLVLVGFTEVDYYNKFAVVRFNTNWTLDTTFNSTGIVVTDFGAASNDEFYATAEQSDGKIVAVGRSDSSGNRDFVLARYNTDGTLDTSFNSTGKVVTDFDSWHDGAFAIALQSDGKILVAGHMYTSGSYDFALARYNTDGSLDTSFNSTGKVNTDINSHSGDYAYAVKVQSNGKIVLAGNSDGKLALVRYKADGSLDTSFNTTGIVTTDLGTWNATINAIALQSDGKILAAGKSAAAGSEDFLLARYDASGILDTTFHTTGILTLDIGTSSSDSAEAIAVQSDGKILLAGRSDRSGTIDFTVVRCDSTGTLDPSFNSTGIVTTNFGTGTKDYGTALALQSDGKVIVSGYSEDASSTTSDFALARYNSDGSLDSSFGTSGKVTTDIGTGTTDYAFGMALLSDGKILSVGYSAFDFSGKTDLTLVRFNADGSR